MIEPRVRDRAWRDLFWAAFALGFLAGAVLSHLAHGVAAWLEGRFPL